MLRGVPTREIGVALGYATLLGLSAMVACQRSPRTPQAAVSLRELFRCASNHSIHFVSRDLLY